MHFASKQRKKIFKALRRNHFHFSPINAFFNTFREALIFVPLSSGAQDTQQGFKHRLALMLSLCEQLYYYYAGDAQTKSHQKLLQLTKSTIAQLRRDIRDELIDFNRIDPLTHAELKSGRTIRQYETRFLVTTQLLPGGAQPEGGGAYEIVVSAPSAYVIVWLIKRLQELSEPCISPHDDDQFLRALVSSAEQFLTQYRQQSKDESAANIDVKAWCSHVIDTALQMIVREN